MLQHHFLKYCHPLINVAKLLKSISLKARVDLQMHQVAAGLQLTYPCLFLLLVIILLIY